MADIKKDPLDNIIKFLIAKARFRGQISFDSICQIVDSEVPNIIDYLVKKLELEHGIKVE